MRSIKSSIQLFLICLKFVIQNKKLLILPMSILLGYGVLFAAVFGSLFYCVGPLRIYLMKHPEVFLHWYFWAGFILYYACCYLIFTFFNASAVFYIEGRVKKENRAMTTALKLAGARWRYMLWGMVVGNVLFFFLALIRFFSDEWWEFWARFFGGLEKAAVFFVQPVSFLENRYGLNAVRRSSALLRQHYASNNQSQKPIRFSWIYALFILIYFIVLIYVSMQLQTMRARTILVSISVISLLLINLFYLLLCVSLQTLTYLNLVSEKPLSEFPDGLLKRSIP